MSQYTFVWKGKDPTGKKRSERVVAENAQAARQQLTLAGWTELELVMDEVGSLSSQMVDVDPDLDAPETTADEDVEYFHGKAPPFFGPWLKSFWDLKFMLLVAAAFLAWGILRDRTWPVVVGGMLAGLLILLHPVLHFLVSGVSREYSRLNRAKVWCRHKEVLECVARLRKKRGSFGMGVGELELTRCEAQALAGLGQLEAGVAKFKQFEEDPATERWMYLTQLATIYDAAKAFEPGLALRKEAAQLKPDNNATWIDLAFSHVRGLNQPAEARVALAEAEKLEITGLGKAYLPFLRGVICWREKNHAEARKHLEEATQTLQPFAFNELAEGIILMAKSHLCAAQRALGNHAEADKLFREVEKFLIANQEPELLAACRPQAI